MYFFSCFLLSGSWKSDERGWEEKTDHAERLLPFVEDDFLIIICHYQHCQHPHKRRNRHLAFEEDDFIVCLILTSITFLSRLEAWSLELEAWSSYELRDKNRNSAGKTENVENKQTMVKDISPSLKTGDLLIISIIFIIDWLPSSGPVMLEIYSIIKKWLLQQKK